MKYSCKTCVRARAHTRVYGSVPHNTERPYPKDPRVKPKWKMLGWMNSLILFFRLLFQRNLKELSAAIQWDLDAQTVSRSFENPSTEFAVTAELGFILKSLHISIFLTRTCKQHIKNACKHKVNACAKTQRQGSRWCRQGPGDKGSGNNALLAVGSNNLYVNNQPKASAPLLPSRQALCRT